MPRYSSPFASLVFSLALLPGTAAMASPSDAWLTTKVKITLLTTGGVDAGAVDVDTVRGLVTLHGVVATAGEKKRAEAAARSVRGVRDVRSLLQAMAPAREAATRRSDDEIHQQVDRALAEEGSLSRSSVSVQSVHGGVVLLQGRTVDLLDHLTAVEVASSVPGVHRVASEIESPDTIADARIWRWGAMPAAGGSVAMAGPSAHDHDGTGAAGSHRPLGTLTGAAADLYLTSMVKMSLLADRRAPALDINVDTERKVVTLFGIIPSETARSAAGSDAGRVAGVAAVKNELEVVPAARQSLVVASDDVVASDLRRNLHDHQALKEVEVDVKNCIARLTGKVPTGIDRVEALQVARSTRGVCAVRDDLRFE